MSRRTLRPRLAGLSCAIAIASLALLFPASAPAQAPASPDPLANPAPDAAPRQSPIDARAAEEVTSATLRAAQRRNDYQSLDELPPIRYIRPEIPDAQYPRARGERYAAWIPDTLDLADRASLFIHHLGATTVAKTNYEPVGALALDAVPPRILVNANESICGGPKYRESLPLMRLMSGNADHLEIDETWARVILHSIGPDGLFYVPLTGRPWDTGAYSWVIPPDGGDQYAYLPTTNGRLLGALGIYYRLTGDEVWKKTGEGIVDRLNQLVIWDGDKAFFPKFVYFPNEKLTPGQIELARRESANLTLGETERNAALWQTWLVTGLAQFYRVSGYEPANTLAHGLMNYVIDRRFTPEGHFDDHFHCGTLGIHAMCELALASNDPRLAELANKAYAWGKSPEMGAIPQMGYFAVMQHQRFSEEPMEPCSVADMTAIALKLIRLGQGDYWDDVDAYARNCLVEAQVTAPYQVSDYVARLQAGSNVGNRFGRPVPRPEPVGYTAITAGLPEKLVGFFSSTIYPNEKHGQPWSVTCCTGNSTRALYYVWQNILNFEPASGALTVNLLLNRASPWADVDSYLPYQGRVVVNVRQPLAQLRVRMNGWIDLSRVGVASAGKPVSFVVDGRYVVLSQLRPGESFEFSFPIAERVESVESFKLKYQLVFRGADVVAIDPPGHDQPLFERAHYRAGQPRFVHRQRFAPATTLDW